MGGFDDYTLAGDSTVGPTGAMSWATHRPSGRAVAVVELPDAAASDEAFLARLRSTAAALSATGHPNVLPLRDIVEGPGVDGAGRVWVVEDWVDGRELGDVIQTDGPLTAEQSVAIVCGVLRGMAAVHGRGAVHGDVSPATIVIAAGGVPELVGFGFAGLPGRPPADAGADVAAVVTVLRDLLAGAPSATAHRKLDKALERATAGKARRGPVGAAELLATLEKAARSDFGRRWERTTSLAPLAAPRPPARPAAGTAETASPVAPTAETQQLPVEETPTPPPVAETVAELPDPPPPPPVAEPPAAVAETPAAETPAAEPPAAETPAAEPPAAETPATEPPAAETEAVAELPDPPAPPPPPVPGSVATPPPPPVPEAVPTPSAEPVPQAPSPQPAAADSRRDDVAAASTTWGDQAPVTTASPAEPRSDRPPPGRRLVRNLTGVILLLLGAGAATAVERSQTDDSPSVVDRAAEVTVTVAAPTEAEITAADVTGAWDMTLTVVESTGFFGTRVGNSVDKIYTITSDCSATPCVLKLEVTGQPGRFTLRQDPAGYVLSESGPNDCVDLPSGAVRVPNGGVASVQAHLRPSGATRTPRGDWAATGLIGSIVTTFETSNPACVQGPGVQRSSVVGVRR